MTRKLSALLVVFIMLLPGILFASTTELPQTGQDKCYNANGGEVYCPGTGQDGDFQAGVVWTTPRFFSDGAGTRTDSLTGLMWTLNANAPGPSACSPGMAKTWQGALDYVKCLNTNNYLGFNDWRLPNIIELRSLTNAGQKYWLSSEGFTNLQSSYWSSTTMTDVANAAAAYSYSFDDGTIGRLSKNSSQDPFASNIAAWPVRDGQVGSALVNLPRTGQTSCYDSSGTSISCAGTGQDGALQKGMTWPSPRFTVNTTNIGTDQEPNIIDDGTVTDNLTGLIWLKDAGCFSGLTDRNWSTALQSANELADGACNLSDGSVAGDWRLPNMVEMASLVNWQLTTSADWLNAQGFLSVNDAGYLTSTSTGSGSTMNRAWVVTTRGLQTKASKTDSSTYFFWPVRGGIVSPHEELLPPQLSYSTNGLNLSIDWTSVTRATGYTLYYAPIPYTGPESIGSIDMGSATSFKIALWDGAAYYVAVSAYNDHDESGYSNIEAFTINSHALPNAPQLGYAINGTRITMNWNSVPNATGYRLNFMTSAYTGPGNFIPVDLGAQTSFSYDQLQRGATYTIAMQAYNANGTSDYSNIETFTVP